MNAIDRKFQKLNSKLDILAADSNVADIHKDGLLASGEASAMITGLMGGKGALPDGTDLNNVTHGGVYYLPPNVIIKIALLLVQLEIIGCS